MDNIVPLHAIRRGDENSAGNKAVSLGELIAAGCETPAGFCIPVETYHAAVAANGLPPRIAARLAATELDDPVDLEAAAEEIRGWIEQMPIPAALASDIEQASRSLGAALVAVRVSRIVEDVTNPRASGLEQAFLAVRPDALVEHLRRAWATPWTSRAIYYRRLKKMEETRVGVAVVVQAMADADAAGVLFTANPLTFAADELHIDANRGLGEAVNAARWPLNHFVVGKRDLQIRERDVPGQELQEVAAAEGGLQTVTIPPEQQAQACLDDAQIVALAKLGLVMETRLGAPQDIEWCRLGERLLLLQTRPLVRK